MQDRDSIANDEQEANSDLSLAETSSEVDSGEVSVPSRQQPRSPREGKLYGITRAFSGPLPSPEILKAYDLVEPGLARKIVDLAEKQAEHRMSLEKAVVLGDGRRSWAGLILGFIISCLFLVSSAYIIIQGHDLAGGLLAGGGLVSLVSVFVYGTNARAQERSEKRKALLDAELDRD
ncbi:MAG: DUF2335 domain-containing protein [Desertifilum sp. SIO1I2]|nr:DUF2335 domain-containing protein [Desertifilum sp. SIO1I2]